jgi:trimeric autotransporter adhesin
MDPFFSFISVDGADVILTGANLHLRNGLGATNGHAGNPNAYEDGQTAVNGLGNLIVGYDEGSSPTKTGSHNVVLGTYHAYQSFGGIVVGW